MCLFSVNNSNVFIEKVRLLRWNCFNTYGYGYEWKNLKVGDESVGENILLLFV